MKTEANDYAFPTDGNSRENTDSGLTKREYFAAMAMSGLCSALAVGINNDTKDHAETAVRYSDALIKALNEQP